MPILPFPRDYHEATRDAAPVMRVVGIRQLTSCKKGNMRLHMRHLAMADMTKRHAK
jgi:hypothetical protein